MTVRVDAAIVGGGPAGSIAARRLARLGWRVMLVERGPPNRSKTCGHCLGPRALALLQREGLLSRVRGIAIGQSRTLRVHGLNGSTLTAPLSEGGRQCAGLLTPRDRLDQTLRDAAAESGAHILQPASARVIEIDDQGATLSIRHHQTAFNVRCRLLVGADGVGSTVARAARIAGSASAGRKYGLSLDLPVDQRTSTLIEAGTIDMFLAPGGYLGAVRQDGGRLHVAALITSHDRGAKGSARSFLHSIARMHHPLSQIGVDRVAQSDDLHINGAGPLPWRPHRVVAPSVALIGDAAGYIEPFTGEGMTWAIESAVLLADSVAAAPRGAWSHRAADMYQRMWRRTMRPQHRRCRLLAGAIERPALSQWMVRIGATAPRLARRIVREVVMP